MQYDKDQLRHLFDYLIWADRLTFDAGRRIPEAEYYKDRAISAGSIHQLFVHQMVAQRTWLRKWQGEVLTGRLENQTEYPTRDVLAERWPIVHAGLMDFISAQTNESLNAIRTILRNNGEPITAPLGATMMHVADHGTYHRGQMNTMFKQAGVEPVYMPYFRFALAQGSAP